LPQAKDGLGRLRRPNAVLPQAEPRAARRRTIPRTAAFRKMREKAKELKAAPDVRWEQLNRFTLSAFSDY